MSYVDHGRRHSPGGTDPVTGFIGFNIDNIGGWLHIETNDVDGDALAIKFVSNGGDTYWYPSGLGQDQNGEWWLYGDGGSSIGVYSGGGIDIVTGSEAKLAMLTNVDLYAGVLGATLVTPNRYVRVAAGEADASGVVLIDGRNDDGDTASVWVGKGLTATTGMNHYTLEGILNWLDAAGMKFVVLGPDSLPALEIASDYTVDWHVNRMTIKLENTANLEVQDSGGNPIFRVDQDGDLHGLTGKALTFDL